MLKIIHNNSCSKSRAILEFLDENNIQFEIIDIVQNPLSVLEIKTLLKKLGIDAIDLVRKNEPIYKENYEGKDFTEDELIQILAENPPLIQRPILIKERVAMIGRPIENVRFFLEK